MSTNHLEDMDKAEFDKFAEEYYEQHASNIAFSGYTPEFFAEYKIADAAQIVSIQGLGCKRILDFGSGIGNSIPGFRKYFPSTELICADVSAASIELSQQRYPGAETYVEIQGDTLPFPRESFDLVFSACVFHHIPHLEHRVWLTELFRVTRPGGLLLVFEHNPWNPLTLRAVNTCAFDTNARLIAPPLLRASMRFSGWQIRNTWYRIYFPRSLIVLRPLERYLRGIPLGGQYCAIAQKLLP